MVKGCLNRIAFYLLRGVFIIVKKKVIARKSNYG